MLSCCSILLFFSRKSYPWESSSWLALIEFWWACLTGWAPFLTGCRFFLCFTCDDFGSLGSFYLWKVAWLWNDPVLPGEASMFELFLPVFCLRSSFLNGEFVIRSESLLLLILFGVAVATSTISLFCHMCRELLPTLSSYLALSELRVPEASLSELKAGPWRSSLLSGRARVLTEGCADLFWNEIVD